MGVTMNKQPTELPKMPNPKFCGDRFFAYQLEQYRSEMKQQLNDCDINKWLIEYFKTNKNFPSTSELIRAFINDVVLGALEP